MSEDEREEIEFQLNAKTDYLSEAFGAEARLLNAQAIDEINEFENNGWPGDGSGTDDLADLNANEANDYRNE
jgi:hypothetical protein